MFNTYTRGRWASVHRRNRGRSNDMRCACDDVLVADVFYATQGVQEEQTKRMRDAFKAGQEAHSPTVEPRQVIHGSHEPKYVTFVS